MNFVTIDFETANSSRASICSIGLAKYENGKLVQTLETFINPEDEFDYYNIEIHGITEEMVKDAPTFIDYYPLLSDFIEHHTVLAHYAAFDMSVLRHACNKYSLDYPLFKYSCTYQLSKKLLPNELNYKLNSLAAKYQYEFTHHDALEDAKACGHVLLKLFEETNTNSFIDLLSLADLSLGEHFSDRYRPSQTKFYKSSRMDITTTVTEFNQNHVLFNKTVTFTGTLKSMVRKEAAQKVVDLGGIYGNGVTKNTAFLVVGDYDLTQFGAGFLSSKMKKASQLKEQGQNIEIVGEQEFLKML
ncbi:exonuclease domain-containing protein [Sporosarcina saromensis]|uniref:Exonuclease domain-containing protein n=1 Tax=Sporosarcina saromensis TaxID=359365 RepID=A0ABU4G3P4_9BACL|nr:exonuclease domain-containing protein [Sporosarcina saromensis]MDW0111586.1 exonuclease domain-containing protein [Sporosarcina saromensis]